MKLKRYFLKTFFIFLLVVLAGPSFNLKQNQVSGSQVEKPMLLDASVDSENRLLLEGLTGQNKKIKVYLNGSFEDFANIGKKIEENAYPFSYRSNFILSQGRHKITVIAKDKNSKQLSPPVNYTISAHGIKPKDPVKPIVQPSIPAPIIVEPKPGYLADIRPKITGLTANNTKVLFYLNKNLIGKTDIVSDPSGTGSFVFTPREDIKPGSYELWAVSKDPSGRKSEKSNRVNFSIIYPEKEEEDVDEIKEEEEEEAAVKGIKTPQILSPEKRSFYYSEKITVSGKVNQVVDEFNVYINNSLEKVVKPEIEDDEKSVFSHDLKKMEKGSYVLYLTASREGREGPRSSELQFEIIEPKIDNGVKKEKPTTTETEATTTDDKIDEKDDFVSQEVKRYIVFGAIILVILAWLIWLNKDYLKKRFKKD